MRKELLTGAGVNDACHSFTGGVTEHEGRVLAGAVVYPIFWGSYYSKVDSSGHVTFEHPGVATMMDFLNALTGQWLGGLKQYGVTSMTVEPAQFITLAAGTDPTGVANSDVAAKLRSFLPTATGGPAANNLSHCFIVFLPTTADLSDFPGACGYHNSALYNQSSGNNNLFYAVIATKGLAASLTGQQFVDAISYCVSHELAEMFTNPDDRGWFADADPTVGRNQQCEIGDICETKTFVTYQLKWTVEQYWSQSAHSCLDPSTLPVPGPPPPPIKPICEQLSVEIGRVEEELLTVTREPPSPSRQAQILALETELGKLQASYQRNCVNAVRAPIKP